MFENIHYLVVIQIRTTDAIDGYDFIIDPQPDLIRRTALGYPSYKDSGVVVFIRTGSVASGDGDT